MNKVAVGLAIVCVFCLSPLAQGKKVLRYSENGSPTTLDPTQCATVYCSLLIKNLYDTLFEYKYLKRPYELKPNLAAAMPKVSKDGLTYTIKIRPKTYYVDDPCFKSGKGREVVAEDIVYSIKRHFDPKSRSQATWLFRGRIVGLDDWKKKGANYSKTIEGLKALDKYTLQIKLVKPYPQLLYVLAMSPSVPVPKEAVQKYKREFSVRPVGSGPYKLISFNTKKVIMERNPTFRRTKLNLKAEGYQEKLHAFTRIKKLEGQLVPIPDRIEISFMKEQAARWASFIKGSETQISSVPLELLKKVTLSTKPTVKLKTKYANKYVMKVDREFGMVFSNFNMDDPRVGYNKDPKRNKMNKALRCAIRKGFNWPQRIKRFYFDIGEAYPGIIPPGIDGHDETLSKDSIRNDIAGAKNILKQAGWSTKNLPVLEYGGVSSVRIKQFFEQFRGWMRKIGYPRNKIKFKSYATFGDFNRALKKRQVMIIGMGWAIDYPDSENLLQLYYGPNASPGSNNSNYSNPEYDKLFEKSSVMMPSPERTAIYQKLNKMLIDDCVTIAGFSRTNIFLWHKNVLMYQDRDVLGGHFLKYVGFN